MEGANQVFVDVHHRARVVELAAVVRRRKNCDELTPAEKFVALFDDLMGAADKVEVVGFEKFLDHCCVKSDAHSPIIHSKPIRIFFRVAPQQVTKKALFRDVTWPDNSLNLVDFFQFLTQAAVHTQNFVVQKSGDWKTIEAVCEYFPEFYVISLFAFVVKTVDSVNTRTLMISSGHKKVLGELYLIRQKQTHRLQALLSSVDIVSQKQIVRLRRVPAVLEEPQ